ncbi:hypothetical protein F5Y09DRAFT_346454 [Xylaria sp. FL1042]|nr:hypothetical protein F5Y09DRAFT_346454 [Xylaria sp. FL1042]
MQTYIAIISLALAGISHGSPASNEDGAGSAYQFDVRVVDAVGAIIGGVSKLAVQDFKSADVTSDLPNTVVVSVGAVDDDPVEFAYAGYQFSSSAGCSTGGYDGGNREMDCGFAC